MLAFLMFSYFYLDNLGIWIDLTPTDLYQTNLSSKSNPGTVQARMVAQQEMFNCTNFAPGDGFFYRKKGSDGEEKLDEFFGSKKIIPPPNNGYDIYNIYIYCICMVF